MAKKTDIYPGGISGVGIRPTVRPLPYFSADPQWGECELAASLRQDFRGLVARRLPDHHLVGQRHGSVPAFVARHKKQFPYFVRTDIANFYPAVRHGDLVVGVQLAYRDLLGLGYVPEKFKRRFGVPLAVYMDDVLVCCRDAEEAAEIYALIANRLQQDFDLVPNYAKTRSGRFSETALTYCGWRFAGGYAGIAPGKTEAFRTRIDAICRRSREVGTRVLVKRLNATITGFGHYYKYGDVSRRFAELHVYIRRRVRRCLGACAGRIDNGALRRLGLRSLCDILIADRARTSGHRASSSEPRQTIPALPSRHGLPSSRDELEAVTELLVAVSNKLTELVKGQRKLLRMLEPLRTEY